MNDIARFLAVSLALSTAAEARPFNDCAPMLTDQAKDRAAITCLEEVFAAKPIPNVLMFVGNRWERLGELHKAMETYDRLLSLPDVPPETADKARTERAALESRLGRIRLVCPGSVAEARLPSGAALGCGETSDGLKPGPVEVVLTSQGMTHPPQTVEVEADQTHEISPPEPDPPPELELIVDPGLESPPDEVLVPIEHPEPIGPWVMVGSGVALTATALVLVNVQPTLEELNALPEGQAHQDLAAEMDLYRDLTRASYIMGGALIAGGVVWRLLAPEPPDDSPIASNLSLSAVPSPHGAWIGVTWVFP